MRNLKMALLCAAFAVFMTASAKAQSDTAPQDPMSYFGMEYQQITADYGISNGVDWADIYADKFTGIALYYGLRLDDTMGIEIGSSSTTKEQKDFPTGAVSKIQLRSISFDWLGYHLLKEENKLELIGSVGLARTTANVELTSSIVAAVDNETETKLRVGVGMQYEIAQNIKLRSMLRWLDADFGGVAKSASIFSVGLHYMFN